MDTSVILGAAIMLVGVASGFGFSFLAGELRDRKNRKNDSVTLVQNTQNNVDSDKVSTLALKIGSQLSSVKTALATYASKPIPVNVGDDIDGVVDEVIKNANNLSNLTCISK